MPVGDQALLVELGDTIDETLNIRILALAADLQAAAWEGVVEVVPTYRSLLFRFDPDRLRRDLAESRLLAATRAVLATGVRRNVGRRWQFPVVYGGRHGPDLEDLATHHGLRAESVIARHAASTYRVAMIGFQPGFAYLAGLDPGLARSRRPEPRPRVPAGAVSIGGAQAAIHSVEAPSGWHLLGRSPVRLFMPDRDPPFLLRPGDQVRFEHVPADAWQALDARAAAGEPVAALLG